MDTAFYEIQLAGRPTFQFGETKIKESQVIDSMYYPVITTNTSNNGNRTAIGTKVRAYTIYNNFKNIYIDWDTKYTKLYYDIYPKGWIAFFGFPRIPIKYKDDFYYCIILNFYDEKTNRHLTQGIFLHYEKIKELNFFVCDNEKHKLIKRINQELKGKKLPLIRSYGI